MRRAVLGSATAVVLAGPTALAFFAGGYFDKERVTAGLVAWALVLVSALLSPRPLPTTPAAWAALGGLVLLAVWSAISLAWAPLAGAAIDNVQRLVLYVGAFLAAIGLLRTRGGLRWLEPALALGALVVIGYGLALRLLPGLIDYTRDPAAGGRLEQPLTYWNAEGVLAGIGLVLCARLVGDRSRPTAVRALAAAASAPLGAGVYLSYSRGALVATLVGLIVLLAVAPSRAQLRGALLALAAGVAAAACAAALPGVASLAGTAAQQQRDGAVMLAVLTVVMVAAGATGWGLATLERRGRLALTALPGARRLPAVVGAAVVLALGGLIVGGLRERPEGSQRSDRTSATQLASVGSDRYEYWRVAVNAFAGDPLQGVGSGGFRAVWLRDRRIGGAVNDAHSLVLEVAAELGVVGLVALALLLSGLGLCARRALRRAEAPIAGAVAAAAVWLLHATIDWDWQMPAVTLPAIAVAGALVAVAEPWPEAPRGTAAEPEGAPEELGAAPGEPLSPRVPLV